MTRKRQPDYPCAIWRICWDEKEQRYFAAEATLLSINRGWWKVKFCSVGASRDNKDAPVRNYNGGGLGHGTFARFGLTVTEAWENWLTETLWEFRVRGEGSRIKTWVMVRSALEEMYEWGRLMGQIECGR